MKFYQLINPLYWLEFFTLYGGGKGGGPPAPNEGMIRQAETAEKIAGMQMDLAREFIDYAKKTADELNPVYKKIYEEQFKLQQILGKDAAEQSDYYRTIVRPFEQKLIADAEKGVEPGEIEKQAQKAKVDVEAAFANVQGQQQRQMARRGIDMGSGAFQALNQQLMTQKALAQAGGMNQARDIAEDKAYARKQNIVAMTRGITPTASTSGQASSAIGGQAAGTRGLGANFMSGAYGQGANMFGGASRSTGVAGNIYGQEYQGRMQAYQAQQQAQAGLGQGIGTLIGMGLSGGTGGFATSPFGTLLGVGKDGGEVQGVTIDNKTTSNQKGMGGNIFGQGGGRDDMVDAVHAESGTPIKLSNGEYIIRTSSTNKYGLAAMDAINKGEVSEKGLKKLVAQSKTKLSKNKVA